MILKCIECESDLLELPFFNNKDENFVPSIPFCPNAKCKRHGLLTITYKTEKEKNVKGNGKKVQ